MDNLALCYFVLFGATACSLGNSPGNFLCMREGRIQFGCKVAQARFCHN